MEKIYKTKSEDWKVQQLYKYIFQNENRDTDYWNFGGNGDNDIVRDLEKFQPGNWIALKEDLINWTPFQIEILANALVDGGWDYNFGLKILNERSLLFAYIFSFIKDDLAFELLDKMEFIIKGKTIPKESLQIIKKRVEKFKSEINNRVEVKYVSEFTQRIELIINLLEVEIVNASR